MKYQAMPSDAAWAERQLNGDWAVFRERPPFGGHDPRQPFTIKSCKHGLMAYNRNDSYIGSSLDAYGEWCEFEIMLMNRVVGEYATVIDVGANIGTHTLAFSKMVGERGKVYAFEPQPRLYRLLTANAALNMSTNVIPRMMAVGRECGRIQMADLPPDETLFNFGAVPADGPSISENSTQIVTIDSIPVSPSLIKIDVEGMEADVIAGARDTIRRCQPVLYVEANGDCWELAAWLHDFGYRAWWSVGAYFNPRNYFGNPRNIWAKNLVPSTNIIATPKLSHWRFDLPEFDGVNPYWDGAKQEPKGLELVPTA